MKSYIHSFIILLYFSNFAITQTTETGDIFSRMSTTISSLPGDSGDDYILPTLSQINSFNQIAADLLVGNYLAAADTATTLDYQLIEYTDNTITPNPTYYLLEKTASGNHWGTYIYNPNACRPNIIIQSPHPRNDTNTGKQGIHVFRKIDAGFFFMSGTHRCNHSIYSSCSGTTSTCGTSESFRISDMPHVDNSIFHHLTSYLFDNIANSYFIQLHGFGKLATDPYVILSNGTLSAPTGNDDLVTFKNHLFSTDNTLTFKIGHIDNWTRLIGRTNTQGRYINSSSSTCSNNATATSGRFFHVEQERIKLRNDITGWDKIATALALTFPENTCTFLPIELLYFKGIEYKNGILLEWETVLEDNADRFELEHSNDGIRFEKTTALKANGYPSQYSYRDQISPQVGNNYYRLKKIDLDGTYGYSKIINIPLSYLSYEIVYPNPSNGNKIFLSYRAFDEIKIYDSNGSLVKHLKYNISNSLDLYEQEIPINIHNLKAGIYHIQLLYKHHILQSTFIKS